MFRVLTYFCAHSWILEIFLALYDQSELHTKFQLTFPAFASFQVQIVIVTKILKGAHAS